MAYTIKNFAQTETYTVNDSTANTNAVSLTLLGKSLPNYGTYFNQNFVWLMENFSSDSANPPPYPVQGQLWWDSTYKFLNVYNGTTWNTVYGNLATLTVNGAVTFSSLNATTITANAITANSFSANSMYAGTIGNTGTSLVGTISTAAQTNITSIGNLTTSLGVGGVYHDWGTRVLSVNGSIPAVTLGTGGTTVNAYMYYANTQKLIIGTKGIVSGTPIDIQPALTGAANGTTTFSFTTSSDLVAVNNGQFRGYHTGALGANTPNTVVATSVTTSSGGQHIGYLTGALGANTPNTVVATSVTTSSGGQVIGYITGAIGANSANTGRFTTVTATSTYFPGGNASVDIGTSGLQFANVYGVNYFAANSFVPIANNVVDIGSVDRYLEGLFTVNATVANSIIPTANTTVNIGSAQRSFNNIYGVNFFGTSTTAKYADLAEKYTLDKDYPIGTVVMIGGDAEATQHDGRNVRALGSVSSNPAYKMNDGLVNGTYIALKGRVPVRVIGPVTKGQSLRGGQGGLAIAEEHSTAYTFAIAMETVSDIVETTIEAVIL